MIIRPLFVNFLLLERRVEGKMDELKRKYAKFLIEGCLKLQEGDKLFIIGYNLIEDFIKIIIEEAKKLGIRDIKTLINDPFKQKELYLTKSYEEIISDPLMDRTMYNKMARDGYAFLSLSSTLPGFYEDVNAELLSKVARYQMKSISEYKEYQLKGKIKWNISAVPNKIWAKDLFGLEDEDKLWNVVFDICLIREDDPIVAWEQKLNMLKRRAEYLNNLKIDHLVYRNSFGTNVSIGLPRGYLFCSADEGSGKGNIVNMPTEEVFTSPDRLRVNGRVYSSKVLLHNSNIIEDFWLEFKDGKIVNYDAKRGKEILKGIIETDGGSHYLGEVAIVDYTSPISLTNILFKNTLFDENASCHLAIGEAFPECIENGLDKSKEELLELGLNMSHEHVDFFIGTSDLEIKAVLQNGGETVIMKDGNFVEV